MDDAYWWAREAIVQSPGFLVAYNTLGAVYRKHGNLREAEAVLRYVLAREPDEHAGDGQPRRACSPTSGSSTSRSGWRRTLAKLEPEPPFAFFNRGMAAMRAGDLRAAKESFEREIARAPDYHEFHFWLAVAHVGPGRAATTRASTWRIAMKNSTTRRDHDLYAAKLDRLNAVH